jgi:hypothetical protein
MGSGLNGSKHYAVINIITNTVVRLEMLDMNQNYKSNYKKEILPFDFSANGTCIATSIISSAGATT